MASKSTVAVVTGANKGIGLAIVRNMALQYPTSPFKSGPLQIYLTARSAERGAEACKKLDRDPQLEEAKVLARDGGDVSISFHALDISDSASIHALRDFLQQQHPSGIDIVINNAGIAMQGFDATVVRETLRTNYYGTLEASQLLLPLIKRGGRLVNVSSTSGILGEKYSAEIRDAFLTAAQTSIMAVTALMERFTAAVERGEEKQEGFPSAAYAVSKAGETAFTKVLAMEEAKSSRDILINACCPGYVNTDMTRGNGVKSPDEGSQTPVLLALSDLGGKTGEFWKNEVVVSWAG